VVKSRNYSFLNDPASQRPTDVDWVGVFADPTLPLVLDLGCGAGRFVLLFAQQRPGVNVLGVDVHRAVSDCSAVIAPPCQPCVRVVVRHACIVLDAHVCMVRSSGCPPPWQLLSKTMQEEGRVSL
jgi:hypothetical protein